MPEQAAVVTGVAQGIGRGCALPLACRGFAVALVDVQRERLTEAATAVHSAGAEALLIEGDVASYVGVERNAQTILETFGRVDVLVNNAGISQPKGLLETSEAEFDHTIAVNLKCQFNRCKALAPSMLKLPEARIVNISSVSTHTGAGFGAVSRFAYCAATAGVLGLRRIGTPEDIAEVVAFLAAVTPNFITGEVIDVDGGQWVN